MVALLLLFLTLNAFACVSSFLHGPGSNFNLNFKKPLISTLVTDVYYIRPEVSDKVLPTSSFRQQSTICRAILQQSQADTKSAASMDKQNNNLMKNSDSDSLEEADVQVRKVRARDMVEVFFLARRQFVGDCESFQEVMSLYWNIVFLFLPKLLWPAFMG